MTVVLYDLVGRDDRRFSPNCWRSRMALAHKGLDCIARPTRFSDLPIHIPSRDQPYDTVPIIEDGDNTVSDSWDIAEYLETNYPDHPSLFGGSSGKALTTFIKAWTQTVLHPGILPLILLDIYEHLTAEDRDYFRQSREKRFGKSLQDVQAERDRQVEVFRHQLQPLRLSVREQAFLGGDAPLYADHLAFSAFQWARTVSPFRVLSADDPVYDWFQRCLDLYGGLGRSAPGYD